MRSLVLRKYKALQELINRVDGKATSDLGRMTDFHCRMKSIAAALDQFNISNTGGLQDKLAHRLRFLQRIFDANSCNCYFQNDTERPVVRLAKICYTSQEYRENIYQANLRCGTSENNAPSIPEEDSQNVEDLSGALPRLAGGAAFEGLPMVKADPKLAKFTTALNGIKIAIAQGTRQSTREVVNKLAKFCTN
jgi:hypothetical protein